MKIRFEVAERKAPFWKQFIDSAKRFGEYSIRKSNGVTYHVVELENTDSALEVWHAIRGWKAVISFVDGKLIPAPKIHGFMIDLFYRERRTKEMLRGVVEKAERKRQEGDDENRWRMGSGPEPK